LTVLAGLAEVAPLLERLLPSIRSWAHGRLPRSARSRLETADLVQEAAVGALQHLPDEQLRSPQTLRSYIQESIKNRIVDELRRAGRVETHNSEAETYALDAAASPLEVAIDSEDRRRFRSALARLDDDEQMLVVGRVELGYSYRQLALATGRPSADAARVAARRAVLHLARLIDRHRAQPRV
jgi:RNA polymerase sigma-70 factor (ECF subfamily)